MEVFHISKRKMLLKKWAFGICDVYGGGSFNIVNFLYPGFLAMAVGLSPYWISVIMLVARIWDAITDPIMGKISDMTNSRFGKRRIYLIVASPLVIISFILMFYPYAFDSTMLRVFSALGSYLIFCTVQTMIMIPYYSLSSEISADYQQRASFNSWRLGFSIFSSILCVAVPGMIVASFDGNSGYIVMGASFGVVFALCVLTTGLFAREEIKAPAVKSGGSIFSFGPLYRMRPYRQQLIMFLAVSGTMAIMSGLFFFYINFYICQDLTAQGKPNMLGLLAAALMFGMQIVALPFYLWLIGKTSKTYAYRLGAGIWIVSALLLYFVKPDSPHILIYVLAAVIGFGISGPGLVPHTMFGDVADYSRLNFGTRNDGQLGGCSNFTNKVISAIALAIVMAVLGVFGFQEQVPGAAAVVSQPESAQNAIRFFMCIVPIFTLGIGIFTSTRYKIDAHNHKRIRDAIANNDKIETEELLAML
jgi:oligogalacturonide transporter